MDRLGIEEGEHIESKMVTRAVENAQKKVEALHFESRKHLLEYDDVANKQRKTIYNFRNELLNPNFDIDSKIKEIRFEFVTNLLFKAEIYEGIAQSEYNIERLISILQDDLNETFEIDALQGLEFEDLRALIVDTLDKNFDAKMSVVDETQRKEIERILYLQVLDNAWRAHLYQMDILKTGIGLRGYNQKDPLTEYKKESYNLFIELVEQIKFESFRTLHIVQLRDNKEEEERRAMEEMIRRMEAANANATLQHQSPYNDEDEDDKDKKTARNEPCPCGSGKKYKQCCGKSGPKKGLLA